MRCGKNLFAVLNFGFTGTRCGKNGKRSGLIVKSVNMSQDRWSSEDEAVFRLLQERRRRAREGQRQARAETVERRRDKTDAGQVRTEGAVQPSQDDDMFDVNLAALEGHSSGEPTARQEENIANAVGEDMFDPNLAALDAADDENIPLNEETIRGFYLVAGHKARRVGRFRAEAIDYQIVVKPLDRLLRNHGAYEVVHALLDSIFTLMRDGVQSHDRIGMIINGGGLQAPIWIPIMRNDQFSIERIMLAVERVLQSNAGFLTEEDGFEVSFLHISMPVGRGNRSVPKIDFEKWMKAKRCFVKIRNGDNMCCARALAVALAHTNKSSSPEAARYYKSVCEVNRTQKEGAIHLHQISGVSIEGSCGIDELKKFQSALKDYQIVVYSKDTLNEILYAGPHKDKQLFLYHYDAHYATITAMPAFLEQKGFCGNCLKGYSVKKRHMCSARCACCRMGPCEITDWQFCGDCRRYFKNPTCFKNHKMHGQTKGANVGRMVCEQMYRCKDCGVMIDQTKDGTKKTHVCGTRYCQQCRTTVEDNGQHLCYMRAPAQINHEMLIHRIDTFLGNAENASDVACDSDSESQSCKDEKPYDTLQKTYTSLAERYEMLRQLAIQIEGEPCSSNSETPRGRTCQVLMKKCREAIPAYIFYDFECRQDDAIGENKLGKIYKHVPNLCIAYRVCTLCWDNGRKSCALCDQRKWIFKGDECRGTFCRWLFSDERHSGRRAIAHNARGYDAVLIKEYLFEQGIAPNVIENGVKIIRLEYNNVTLIDSLSFLAMPLAKFPKTFGLKEMKKGYFPHLFNTKANEGYRGPIPSKDYFDPEGMKEIDAKKQFENWHAEQRGIEYDLEAEMLAYCHSDVDILMNGCMTFRRSFIEASGIDPLKDDVTIAGACSRVYRTRFLPCNTIALIPPQGYTPNHKHSMKAMCWLKWIARAKGINIRHALNGGEIRIGNYLADGLHEQTVYEFYGCLWHGCPTCFRRRDLAVPGTADSVESAYQKTIEREKTIKAKGYKMEVIWEHDFDLKLKENPDMVKFYKDFKKDIRSPLNPRDGFYGGRTGATRLYYKAGEGEKISYVDVCSLYPWVNKIGKYPVGHPEIITENFEDIQEYDGLIKCQLFPPRKLYHPVIPYRPPGPVTKLMFTLCRTCAIEKQQTPCTHSEDERMLEGTWVTDEIKHALSKGYTMGNFFEVWHFREITQYDPETKIGGLFTGYINTFLKVKQEASGWPSDCCFAGEEEGLPIPKEIQTKRELYVKEYLEKEGVELDSSNIKHNPGKPF